MMTQPLALRLLWAVLALALTACSSDSDSGGGSDDPTDEFVYGAWVEGTLGTPVVSEPATGAWSDYAPTTAPASAGDTYTQTRMRTITTITTTPRSDSRSCEVKVNGNADTPPLDCANAETTRIFMVVDTDEVVDTETREVDNAADTAQWVDTSTPASTGGGDETDGTDQLSGDVLSFITDGGANDGKANLTFTLTPTTDISAATSTQEQICQRVIVGLEDTGTPTCTDGNATHALGATANFTSETTAAFTRLETEEAETTTHNAILNPMQYDASDLDINEFRNANVTNGWGYDIVNRLTDKRFLITNEGTGQKGIVTFSGENNDTRNFCFDTNTNGTCSASEGDQIGQMIGASDYATIAGFGGNAQEFMVAHEAGWQGFQTYMRRVNVSLSQLGGILSVANAAPGASYGSFTDSVDTDTRLQLRRDTATTNDDDTLVVFDNVSCSDCAAGDNRFITAVLTSASDTDKESAEIVDYYAIVAGAGALIWHKYPELNPDQIEDIIIGTRDSDKRLQLLKALSPVGELQ